MAYYCGGTVATLGSAGRGFTTEHKEFGMSRVHPSGGVSDRTGRSVRLVDGRSSLRAGPGERISVQPLGPSASSWMPRRNGNWYHANGGHNPPVAEVDLVVRAGVT